MERPWLITIWCLAHQLGLALNNALKVNLLLMLMQIYYLYTKSPKNAENLMML